MELKLAKSMKYKFSTISDQDFYFLFFLWPFLGLLLAISNFRARWAKNLFWLYTVFYGFTFIIYNEEVDASRYRDALIMMHSNSFSLNTLFSSYLGADSGVLDIAQRLITFFVSRFTIDYRFLFAAFGFFLGYFLSRMIWFLIDRSLSNYTSFASLVLISFSLVISFWDIGGIRFAVASVIFVYGVLKYIIDGDKSGLFIAASTIFVHWSFSMALVVLLAYLIFRNRTLIYFTIFVFSFVLSGLNFDKIRDLFFAYAPAAVQSSRGSYLNEYYIQALAENAGSTAWYIKGHILALNWYVFIFTVYFFFTERRKIATHPQLGSLFSFAILFYGAFNIFSTIPSVMRFTDVVGIFFMLAFLFYYLTTTKYNFSKLLQIAGIPVFLLFIVVRLRMGLDYIGGLAVFGSPIFIYFTENKVALIDMIKDLL